MRVLMVTSVFPDAAEPMRGVYNAALLEALDELDRSAAVVPRHIVAWLRGSRSTAAGPASHCDVTFAPYVALPGGGAARRHRDFWRWCRRAVFEASRRIDAEAILSYWVDPDGTFAVRCARELGIPAGIIVGGSDVLIVPRDPRRRETVTDTLSRADRVFCVSRGLVRVVHTLAATANSVAIEQGIDTRVFHPGDRREARRRLGLRSRSAVFAWAGRMEPIKRLDVLLEAFVHLRERLPHATLLLAGEGSEAGTVRTWIARQGIGDDVRLLGALRPQDLAEVYRAADATVLSSDSEGLPNVLRESLACGTPFVSTDVGSVREIHDPRWSLLVPPAAPEALAEAMREVLEDRFDAGAAAYRPRSWSDMARDIVREFSEARSPRGDARALQHGSTGPLVSVSPRTAEPVASRAVAGRPRPEHARDGGAEHV